MRVLELDAVGVVGLAGNDGEAVVVTEVKKGFVLFRGMLDREPPPAGHDSHAKRILQIFIDGTFCNFLREIGDSRLQEKIQVKDEGLSLHITDAAQVVERCVQRESAAFGDAWRSEDFFQSDHLGERALFVSLGRFLKGFNAADGKFVLEYGMVDDMHSLPLGRLHISKFYQLGGCPADGVSRTGIGGCQLVFRWKHGRKGIRFVFDIAFQASENLLEF